ncbi:MAG: hypothetical protein WBP93_11390 [Pyrinomonadaceae bacterium]
MMKSRKPVNMKKRPYNDSNSKLSRATLPCSREHGYTLVALLALMSLLILFALAAAPNIARQAQREREEEAIFRGEQVAEAIRAYYNYNAKLGRQGLQALPTSMDQLLEGIPRGTQKVQILRPEAARDPLTSSGEWKLIRPTDRAMLEFARSVIVYAGNQPPQTSDPSLRQFTVQFASMINTGSKDTAPGGEDDSANTTGPFIGVASRSKNSSIITYYGIDRHDQWVFTPLFK